MKMMINTRIYSDNKDLKKSQNKNNKSKKSKRIFYY